MPEQTFNLYEHVESLYRQREKARAWDGLVDIMNRHSQIVSQASYAGAQSMPKTSDDVLAILLDYVETHKPRKLQDVAL